MYTYREGDIEVPMGDEESLKLASAIVSCIRKARKKVLPLYWTHVFSPQTLVCIYCKETEATVRNFKLGCKENLYTR